MDHPWTKGHVPSYEEVMLEFTNRHEQIKMAMESERLKKEQEKMERLAEYEKTTQAQSVDSDKPAFREGKLDLTEITSMENLPILKKLEPYHQVFSNKTQFFSTYNPDMIESALVKHMESQDIKTQVNAEKYKIKFTIITKDQGNQTLETEICVKILEVDKSLYCVEFSRISGDQVRYLNHYEEIKTEALAFCNDFYLDMQKAQ